MIRMSRIQEIIARRERVAAVYADRLARVPGVRLPYVAPEATRMSWFVAGSDAIAATLRAYPLYGEGLPEQTTSLPR